MSTNRSKALLFDIVRRLRGDFSVTNRLPDGADDVHPAPVARPRDTDVDLVVKLIGGSGQRRGSKTQQTRQVQIRLEVATDYFETKSTGWLYELFDAIEDSLDGLGGGGRAPDGQAGGLGPEYDDSTGRFVADQTYRYTTIH